MGTVLTLRDPMAVAYRRSAESIRQLVDDNEVLLDGLAALRDLGAGTDDAVAAVLEVFELRRLRLGWELLETLLEGDGMDPELLLAEVLGERMLDVRYALLGSAR